jgi:hypothetical protein
LLGVQGDRPGGAVWDGFTENDAQAAELAHRASHAPLQAAWIAALRRIEGTLMFRPWAYLVIALALLPLCRGNRIALALLVSGIAYEFSLLVVAPGVDYRYSHWMVVCAITAAVIVFAARYRVGAGSAGSGALDVRATA